MTRITSNVPNERTVSGQINTVEVFSHATWQIRFWFVDVTIGLKNTQISSGIHRVCSLRIAVKKTIILKWPLESLIVKSSTSRTCAFVCKNATKEEQQQTRHTVTMAQVRSCMTNRLVSKHTRSTWCSIDTQNLCSFKQFRNQFVISHILNALQ